VLLAVSSIRIEPLRESAHRALLAAHHAQGDYAEMVSHYRSLESLLESELGVRPATETVALMNEGGLLRGDGNSATIVPWPKGHR
jgi:DNA-binding SARP family transcriptional activator